MPVSLSVIGCNQYIFFLSHDSLQYAHACFSPELGSQIVLDKYINNSLTGILLEVQGVLEENFFKKSNF